MTGLPLFPSHAELSVNYVPEQVLTMSPVCTLEERVSRESETTDDLHEADVAMPR